jgi:hypothetical protein
MERKHIVIEGYDIEGRPVYFECKLIDGTITENGCCRFIEDGEQL